MVLSAVRRLFATEAVDFTETEAFLRGFVQVALAAVEFGLIFWIIAALELATLDPSPESAVLSLLLGAVPALVLGAGVPYLLQYREYLDRVTDSPWARVIGPVLTFGTYTLLFFYDPVSSVVYAFVYLTSRVAILVGIYGGSRIKTAFD